jgi:hypothetical protein
VGFALYGVASVYELLGTGDPIIKHMVKCKYCRKRISVKVSYSPQIFLISLLLSFTLTLPPLSFPHPPPHREGTRIESTVDAVRNSTSVEERLIKNQAKRCVNCTSWQDGREDKIAEAGDLLR